MKTETKKLWRTWRRRRDTDAFEALVTPEIRYAADLVRRLGASREEAEDAVQRTLAKLAETDSDEPMDVGLRAWMCRRAILDFRMQVRAATRRRKHERSPRPRPRTAPADPTRRLEVRDRVEHALSLLDDAEREAIVLRYLDDLDYPEMAYVLGISVNACRIRVHKALKGLRKRLGPKAAALVAVLGVPALPAEAALVSGAAAGAGAVAAPLVAKLAVAVLSVAAVVTTGVMLAPTQSADEREPVVVVPPPLPPERVPPAEPPPVTPPKMIALAPALEFLEEALAGRLDPTVALWDFDTIASMVAAPDTEPLRIERRGRETELDLGAVAEIADRVVLGPGRWRLTGYLPRDRRAPFEIRGSGAGRTVIDATERDICLVTQGSTMTGLIVRDLTFEGHRPGTRTSGLALDARGTAVALFERVVFRGWQDRAGHGAPVGVSGRALLGFRDCEFVGGYRRVSDATALSIRGDVLALFSACRFTTHRSVLQGYPVAGPNPNSTVHFRDCEFSGSRLTDSRFLSEGRRSARVRLRDCIVALGIRGQTRESRLDEFGAEYAEALTGVRLAAEPPTVTLADLKRALDLHVPGRGERVFEIQAFTWDGADPVYAIHLDAPGGFSHTKLFRLGEDHLEPVDAAAFVAPRPRQWKRRDDAPPLRDLLAVRWSELDADAPCFAVVAGRTRDRRPRLHFVGRYGEALDPDRK